MFCYRQELLIGYYLWQASLLFLAFGTVVLHFGFRPQHTSALDHPKGGRKMRRLTLGLLVWLNFLSALGSLAWARTWTDTTGRFKVEAELVEVRDGNAVLKKADGPVIAVALQKLSPADREYVNHWAALKQEHPWLATDAPFDVVTFLAPFPEAENAASHYLHRRDLFDTQKIQKDYGIRGPVVFPLGNLALVASLTDAKWRLAREKYGNGLPGDTSAANIRPDQAEKSAELMRRVTSGTLTSEEYAQETAAVNRVFSTILGTAGKTSLQRWRACQDPQIVEPLRPTTVAVFFEPEDFVNVASSCLRCEATRRGTQCLVALRRWQLEHREPPPDIEALVKAAGMKAVPIDPYCDRPLRLATDPAAPVIYSVGADGQDDGARTVWDGAPGHPGDFVFRLEPPRR